MHVRNVNDPLNFEPYSTESTPPPVHPRAAGLESEVPKSGKLQLHIFGLQDSSLGLPPAGYRVALPSKEIFLSPMTFPKHALKHKEDNAATSK